MSSPAIKRILTQPATFAIVAAAGLVVHLVAGSSSYDVFERVLSWVLLVLAMYVIRSYVLNRGKSVPLIVMVAAEYYVVFGISVFTPSTMELSFGAYDPPPDTVRAALWVAVTSLILILTVTQFAARTGANAARAWWQLFPDVSRFRTGPILAYGASSVFVFFLLSVAPDAVPRSIRHIVDMAFSPYLSISLLLYAHYQLKSWMAGKFGFLYAIAVAFDGFLKGTMELIVVPFFVLTACAVVFGRRMVNLRWALFAVVAFLILQPVKGQFRNEVWSHSAQGYEDLSDATYRLEVWKDAFQSFWSDPFASEKAADATSRRTNGLIKLAHAIDWVPDVIPYKKGDGFGIVVASFIPRIFWPDKPLSTVLYDRYAVEFGYNQFRILSHTTTGMLLLEEGIWDFGIFGAFLYAGVFAAIIGLLFHVDARQADTRILVNITFAAHMFQCLYALTTFLSTFFSFFVACAIVLKVLKLLSSAAEGQGSLAGSFEAVAE